MRWRPTLRTIGAIVALPLTVIVSLNIESFAQWAQIDQLFVPNSEARMPSWISIIYAPWITTASISGLAFVAGIWVDWLLKKVDSGKPTAEEIAREYADKLHYVGRDLRLIRNHRQFHLGDNAINRLKAAFVTGSKIGYSSPDIFGLKERQFCELAVRYIDTVSPYLRAGHLKEGRLAAKGVCREIAIAAGQKPKSLSELARERLRGLFRAAVCF